MNSFLKQIDIFGVNIPLTFYRKDEYNSNCGGILTIITVIATLFLLVQEMTPIYYRLDPQVFNKMVDEEFYSYYNLSYQNFPIAFRFEDEAKVVRNLDGIVYPYIELIHMSLNQTTGNMEASHKKLISYSNCTRKLISEEAYPSLNGFKCLNYSEFDQEVGGSLFSDDTVYFKITVFYCAMVNGQPQNCTNYETLSRELSGKKKIYFTILVPDVSINPDDFHTPLKMSLDTYVNTLSPLIMRTDRYYYNYIVLERDSGLIFEDLLDYEGFTFYRKDVEYQMRTEEDYDNPNKIKTLSTTVFAIQKRIYKIKVVFKKLQNGLADVGGLIKLISFAFLFLNRLVINEFKFFRLIDDLYQIEIGKGTLQKIFMKNGSFEKLNKQIENQITKIINKKKNNSSLNNALKPQQLQRKKDSYLLDDNKALLKGIYIDICDLNIKKIFDKREKNNNKNSRLEAAGHEIKAESNDNMTNHDCVFYYNKNLYKNNLVTDFEKIDNTENNKNSNDSAIGGNINKNRCKKNSGFSNQTKDIDLVSTNCLVNFVNVENHLNSNGNVKEKNTKNLNEKSINYKDKSSFRDKDSILSDERVLNFKDSTRIDNTAILNLPNNLKKLNYDNVQIFNKGNIGENSNNRDISFRNNPNIFQEEIANRNKFYFSDFFVLRIKDIFNLKDKMKLLCCKTDYNRKKNFQIYYEEREKIAEKMDLINYLKMSYKFEEIVEALEGKRNRDVDLFHFHMDKICLE